MAQKEFNLGEHIINTAFNHIVEQYENVNADCEVVSKFIKKNYSVLDKITPKDLTKAYEYLSLPLDEKPHTFKNTMGEAFGEPGFKLYELMDKSSQREVTIILDNLENIRAQINSQSQKSLFR